MRWNCWASRISLRVRSRIIIWRGRGFGEKISAASVLIPLPAPAQPPNIVPLSAGEQLGKDIFYDATLSSPAGYSCATCHNPQTGFTGPSSPVNLVAGPVPGVIPGRFGRRNPQPIPYAAFSPRGPYLSGRGRRNLCGRNLLGWPHTGHRHAGPNAVSGSKRNGQHADRSLSAARRRLFAVAGAETGRPALCAGCLKLFLAAMFSKFHGRTDLRFADGGDRDV